MFGESERKKLSGTKSHECGDIYIYKVKFSRYRPSEAKRVGRDIALLFHDRGTRRG